MFKWVLLTILLHYSIASNAQTGENFHAVKYAPAHSLELPIRLSQDHHGQIWLFTEQGISLFQGDRFVSYQNIRISEPIVDGLALTDSLLVATATSLVLNKTSNNSGEQLIWSPKFGERIIKLRHVEQNIYIQTNSALYAIDEDSISTAVVEKVSTLSKQLVDFALDKQGLWLLTNDELIFNSTLNQQKKYTLTKPWSAIESSNGRLLAINYADQLVEIKAQNETLQVTELDYSNVKRIYQFNNRTYLQQENQLVLFDSPAQKTELPTSSSQVFIDNQNNLWLLSTYNLQVLWKQPLEIVKIKPPVNGRFDIVTDGFALQQDKLLQINNANDNWQLRAQLPFANNTKSMLTTTNHIWFIKPDRLIAIEKNTFVTTVDIPLEINGLVLKQSRNKVLVQSGNSIASISANGSMSQLKQECNRSCLPSYKVSGHYLDGDAIWLATTMGLQKLDLNDLSYSQSRYEHLIEQSPLLSVLPKDKNHLWLVYPNKLAVFEKNSRTAELLFSATNRIFSAKLNQKNELDIMTQNGWFAVSSNNNLNERSEQKVNSEIQLYKVDNKTGKYASVSLDNVLSLTEIEDEFKLVFSLTKQHPEQAVYFRFKYQDELNWSESLSLAQSITIKNIRQGQNELLIQARLEGQQWQSSHSFIYDMPYRFLQTKWVVFYGFIAVLLGLAIYLIERYKRFKIVFDQLKQQTFINSLLESTKDGVWVANKDREIQSVNVAFEEILGFDSTAILGSVFQINSEKGRNHEVESLIWQEVTKSGFWTGEVWTQQKDGGPVSIDLSVTRVETQTRFSSKKDVKYVGVFSDVTARKNSEKALRHLATRDPLTELANRTLFIEHIERAIATANPMNPKFAVVFVDLDNFSKVNANLGPLQGDALIQKVAERLNQSLDKGVSIARLAGDEFALLVPNYLFSGEMDFYLRRLSGNIKRQLQPSFMLSNTEVNITASLGAAYYPIHGNTPETLMRCADTALKKIKSSGRNNLCIYEKAIDQSESHLLSLESELVKAFDNDEFKVFYQPKYLIQQHKLSGYEALIRWQNPARGLVPPDQFITLAEQNGLIRQLDTAVLTKVCEQIVRWRKQGIEFGKIAVNISALNFQQMEFCQSIKQILLDQNVVASDIELEITESAMMSDPEQTLDNLNDLRSFGFTIALDDFGTGHSSLGHLKTFPIDRIKIDRSFIKDITTSEQDKNITSVIIQLAKHLNISVIAEGVEEQSQAYILHVLGCNEIQGYMISKAIEANEVPIFIQKKMGELPEIALDV